MLQIRSDETVVIPQILKLAGARVFKFSKNELEVKGEIIGQSVSSNSERFSHHLKPIPGS